MKKINLLLMAVLDIAIVCFGVATKKLISLNYNCMNYYYYSLFGNIVLMVLFITLTFVMFITFCNIKYNKVIKIIINASFILVPIICAMMPLYVYLECLNEAFVTNTYFGKAKIVELFINATIYCIITSSITLGTLTIIEKCYKRA